MAPNDWATANVKPSAKKKNAMIAHKYIIMIPSKVVNSNYELLVVIAFITFCSVGNLLIISSKCKQYAMGDTKLPKKLTVM